MLTPEKALELHNKLNDIWSELESLKADFCTLDSERNKDIQVKVRKCGFVLHKAQTYLTHVDKELMVNMVDEKN